MTWEEAREKIEDKDNINVGTDVNNKRTREKNYRIVKDVPPPHFRVQIGENSYVKITWDMLEKCWHELNHTYRWDSKAFKKVFEEFFSKEKEHWCHNHVIGKIFEKAGLVDSADDDYYELKQTLREKGT